MRRRPPRSTRTDTRFPYPARFRSAPGASATNVHLEPGKQTAGELMADVKRGIYVTELIGMGVIPVTGDYSRGASGFLIENGATGPAVAEITIAGNLLDMFAELTAADDLEFLQGIRSEGHTSE